MGKSQVVQTVLGLIDPNMLGKTLTHEHLSMTYNCMLVEPTDSYRNMKECPFKLENYGWIRQNAYSHPYNLDMSDEESHDAVLHDVRLFKECGGGTIVENSNHGLSRNSKFLEEVSQKTGVHVVAGTGFYLEVSQVGTARHNLSIEEMTNSMVSEIRNGCMDKYPDKTGSNQIKCGFIGEIGSTLPIHDFERRAIIATAETQQETNYPVSFHPGRDMTAPFEVIRIFQEAGGDVRKTVMSHLDRSIPDKETLLEFAKLGTYCQLDLFGLECSYYQFNPTSCVISDDQRIKLIEALIQEGHEDRILMSQDIHTKHRLTKFGGHGYHHIQENTIPKLLARGTSEETINKIQVENPKRWLTVWSDDA